MQMQRLVLLGLGVAFFLTQKCSSRCFSKAVVPFKSWDDADAWVTEYCGCLQKMLDCGGDYQCVTELWDFMYQDPNLKMFRDGERVTKEAWDADAQRMIQHVDFTQANEIGSCELASYGPYSVVTDEHVTMFFTSTVGSLFGGVQVPSTTYNAQNKFTFNKEGTFARKERTSQHGIVGHMVKFFNGAKNSAASLAETVVPHSSFFGDAPREMIVFVGCVALVMYLVLMFTIVRVASLCIRGKPGSGSGGYGYQYGGKVQYCTTEIDQTGDVNEKTVLA